MNEALQKLEIKVENGGSTPQGRVSAAEWNVLVAGVKALDLAGFDENALRDYLDQYDYITRPELDKALEGITSGGGGSIEYPLSWSGYSQGMWDGSAPANIAIPHLMSQLTNDSDYITTASVNSLLTDYIDKTSIKNYMGWSQKHHVGQNIDSLFDFGVVSTAGNVNTPSTAAYGVVATFPYRNAYGNSIPDLAAQLYFPNGDEATPHLFWRSSIKNSWNSWRTILDSSNYSNYALPIAGGTLKGGLDFDKTYGSLLTIRDGRYGQSAVISVSYTNQEGDKIKLHIPGAASHDHYLLLTQSAGATLTMGLTVNGNIAATTFLPTGGTAIQFPDGGYIDRYGNIVLPSTASQWSVKNGGDVLMKVGIDGKVAVSDSLNVSKTYGALFSIVADWQNWQNVDIISKLWDENRWDYVKITTPTTYSRNSSINICARGYVEVIGDFFATGEVTQHSSLVLKDVVDTRFLTLKELSELKPYSFYWKDKRDDKLHAGAVADYVKPILPEVISMDKDNIHSMNYANAAWVVGTSLTPYVSKHEEEIEALKSRVKYLENKIKES